MTMTEWLTQYVRDLVSEPEAVSVSVSEGVLTRIVTIKVAAEDTTLFGGRNNRLSRAMTAVAGLAGTKARTRYVLKFGG